MSANDHIKKIKGTIPFVKIYEVEERELEILEKGAGGSLFLNFAIAFFSCAVSTTIAYLKVITTLPPSSLAFMYAVMIIGYSGGLLFILLWRKSQNNHQKILKKIRARIEQQKLEGPHDLELIKS